MLTESEHADMENWIAGYLRGEPTNWADVKSIMYAFGHLTDHRLQNSIRAFGPPIVGNEMQRLKESRGDPIKTPYAIRYFGMMRFGKDAPSYAHIDRQTTLFFNSILSKGDSVVHIPYIGDVPFVEKPVESIELGNRVFYDYGMYAYAHDVLQNVDPWMKKEKVKAAVHMWELNLIDNLMPLMP